MTKLSFFHVSFCEGLHTMSLNFTKILSMNLWFFFKTSAGFFSFRNTTNWYIKRKYKISLQKNPFLLKSECHPSPRRPPPSSLEHFSSFLWYGYWIDRSKAFLWKEINTRGGCTLWTSLCIIRTCKFNFFNHGKFPGKEFHAQIDVLHHSEFLLPICVIRGSTCGPQQDETKLLSH